jgi:thiol:disulfide interchange protein
MEEGFMGNKLRATLPRIGMVMLGTALVMALATVMFGLMNVQHRGRSWWVWATLIVVFALLVLFMLPSLGAKAKGLQRSMSAKELRKQHQAEQSRSVVEDSAAEDHVQPWTGGV